MDKNLESTDGKYMETGAGFTLKLSNIELPQAKFILTNGDRLILTPVEPHVKDFAVFEVIP